MPRRAAKKDSNHNPLARVFERLGCSVADTSRLGFGFPDMVVARRGRTLLVEVKSQTGKLEADQIKFIEAWRAPVAVVTTEQDVIDAASRWL